MQLSRFAFLKDAVSKKPVIVASLSALAAALFASGYLSQREAKLMKISEPVVVVAAASDIAAGESLGEGRLALAEIPRRFVEPGAIASMDEAGGRIAVVPIRAGSQITKSVARLPADGFGLAGIIPSGRRAFSVSLPAYSAASALIAPNDSVDVLATFDLGNEASIRRTTLQIVSGAQVLAVNRRMAGSPELTGEERTKTGIFSSAMPARRGSEDLAVTLSVTPAEAQSLAFAQESAALAIALRPTGEEEDANRTAPTTIHSIAGENAELVSPRKGFREYKGR